MNVKWTLWILGAMAALAFALRGTPFEDDLIRSLTHPDPVRAKLFDDYQSKNSFRDRVFIEMEALSLEERARIEALLQRAGYREVSLFTRPRTEDVMALAPLLEPGRLRALLSGEALERRARDALAMAALPGGEVYLRELQADPIGLGPALSQQLLGGAARPAQGPGAASVRVYQSPRPLDYERVGHVYDALVAQGARVHFIGSDFFALENYRAVKHDVIVCSTLSLALNLLIFFLFTGRWALLGLLLLGSLWSYLTGVLAIRLFYGEIYALVLAYTSTFVGFNNESLVHLAGIEDEHRQRTLLGISSAIGTTFIGFAVLALGRSVLVRQMALASLGGMIGFLLFLWPYRGALRAARFRGFRWPTFRLAPAALIALCLLSLAGIALVGVPRLATRIESFRYQTPVMDAQMTWFSRQLEAFSLGEVVAVPASGSATAALKALADRGETLAAQHPLAAFRSTALQEENLRTLRAGYDRAVSALSLRLAQGGIRFQPDAGVEEVRGMQVLDDWAFLDRVSALGPLRWSDQVGARRFLLVGWTPGAAVPEEAIALSPRPYYDQLLGALSRELGWLFLAGLGVMAGYLLYLQRSALRVVYVFAPLALAALAFAGYLRVTGGTIHIVHVMGFSLVIALALDYTSVAISSGHREVELSKVLLTGASTIATFGVLLAARHPVLRELGATVVLGCGVSLAFALSLRLPEKCEGESA